MKLKKGLTFLDLFLLIASITTIVLFFGTILFGFNLVNDQMQTIGNISINGNQVNVTQISNDSLGVVVEGLGQLRLIGFFMFFAYVVSILLSAYIESKNPGFGFFLHLCITAIAAIVSIEVSNAYEGILIGNVIGPTLQTMTGLTFVMLNLPAVIIVVGFIGMILLYAGIPKDRETLAGGIL